MKKKFTKIFSILVLVIFTCSFFVACSPYREAEKASKGLTSYKISAALDSQMVITATEEVEVVNKNQVALSSLCFNLYGRAFREDATIKPYTSINEAKCFPNGKSYGDMEIISVKEAGEDASFSIVGDDSNALEVTLSKELEPDEKVLLTIEFKVLLAESTHRLGYLNGSVNLGNWFPILAMYEKGEFIIEPYYSTGDPFYSDIANYEVEFTYDDNYRLASSGALKKTESEDGLRTDTLTAIAVRDFAITLTEYSLETSKEVDDILITYVGYEGDENIDYCLDTAVKAVKYFNQTFGKYPYQKLDIVKAPFLHGGMEYPSIVIISDSITSDFDFAKVIVHEIAHQWWYGVVGNNEINEAWLDESLAEYSSVMFFENHNEYDVTYEELVSEAFAGYVLYADIVSSVNKKLNTSMLLPVYEYAGDYEYSYMIYVKGVLMFDNIRQIVGKEKLEDGFKKYYSKYKFKVATTDEFIATMRKATGKDVEGLLDSWLQGKAIIGTI